MTTVEQLHRYLDRRPADSAARCALGDALRESESAAERELADGITAPGLLGLGPYPCLDDRTHCLSPTDHELTLSGRLSVVD